MRQHVATVIGMLEIVKNDTQEGIPTKAAWLGGLGKIGNES